VPAVGWLPRYERRWLRGDLAAGVAVTALVVPKNLGYAGIAGVPLQNGLYAAAAGTHAGAQTPVASLTTGALVIATLIVLAPVFSHLPKAVLGAVINDDTRGPPPGHHAAGTAP
jgi:MFS superfamily sulfate permease-like transporter